MNVNTIRKRKLNGKISFCLIHSNYFVTTINDVVSFLGPLIELLSIDQCLNPVEDGNGWLTSATATGSDNDGM